MIQTFMAGVMLPRCWHFANCFCCSILLPALLCFAAAVPEHEEAAANGTPGPSAAAAAGGGDAGDVEMLDFTQTQVKYAGGSWLYRAEHVCFTGH